jgi:hypothetical protein
VFEISLRFRKCEANKAYKFPKTIDSDESDHEIDENRDLICDKELAYNLHTQNKYKSDPSREKQRLKMLEMEEPMLNKRQKT